MNPWKKNPIFFFKGSKVISFTRRGSSKFFFFFYVSIFTGDHNCGSRNSKFMVKVKKKKNLFFLLKIILMIKEERYNNKHNYFFIFLYKTKLWLRIHFKNFMLLNNSHNHEQHLTKKLFWYSQNDFSFFFTSCINIPW